MPIALSTGRTCIVAWAYPEGHAARGRRIGKATLDDSGLWVIEVGTVARCQRGRRNAVHRLRALAVAELARRSRVVGAAS